MNSSWGVLVLVMGRFASAPGGAASPLPAIRRRTGNEDVAPPGFCKCLYNNCSELLNLVSIAKVPAPLVFAEGKEYNKWRLGKRFLKRVL